MIDFFFVGPSKTASTWVYQALSEHPEFSLPKAKDIYFFDQFYEKGVSWYHDQFSQCDFEKHVGDFSHDYLMNPEALERIRAYNKNAKIIICIRDPYERTESGIRFLQRNGYGFGSVEELVSKHTELIDGSLYGRNLEQVFRLFNREDVLLLDYEVLKHDPECFLKNIYGFFGVGWYSPSVLGKVVNKAKAARSVKLSLFIKKCALFARKLGMNNLVGMLKMNPIVTSLLYKSSDVSFSLTDADRAFLASVFDDDIDLLGKVTGKDYSGWKYRK